MSEFSPDQMALRVSFVWAEVSLLCDFSDWVISFVGDVRGVDLRGSLESQFERTEDRFKRLVYFRSCFKKIPCRDIVEGKINLI